MLGIEIINQCNFNCYFCAAGYKPEKLQKLSIKDIKNIAVCIQELGITFIKLTPSRGEVFMHPDAYEILNIITNIPCVQAVEYHTNFEKIDFNKFLNSGIDINKIRMHVSHYGIDGVDEFTYQTRSTIRAYNTVEENLRKAKQLGVNVIISPRTRDYSYACPDQRRMHTNELQGVCNNSWVPRVLASGKFSYCTCAPDSSNLDERYIIGNIRERSLNDMYLSKERYEFYLKMKLNDHPSICKECSAFTCTAYNPVISAMKNLVKMKKAYDLQN